LTGNLIWGRKRISFSEVCQVSPACRSNKINGLKLGLRNFEFWLMLEHNLEN